MKSWSSYKTSKGRGSWAKGRLRMACRSSTWHLHQQQSVQRCSTAGGYHAWLLLDLQLVQEMTSRA
jgi:hypothetical protein